jgi:hypothetical protein
MKDRGINLDLIECPFCKRLICVDLFSDFLKCTVCRKKLDIHHGPLGDFVDCSEHEFLFEEGDKKANEK